MEWSCHLTSPCCDAGALPTSYTDNNNKYSEVRSDTFIKKVIKNILQELSGGGMVGKGLLVCSKVSVIKHSTSHSDLRSMHVHFTFYFLVLRERVFL